MKKFNLFITLEGGEGTGKSTISNLLQEQLTNEGIEVVTTREPGGTGLKFSEKIRKIIFESHDIDVATELLLFAASRREHVVKVIEPALNNNKMLICDRFIDSTRVYQGIVKGLDKKFIEKANSVAIQGTEPDITIIFDLDPVIGFKRIMKGEREVTRFDQEDISFHEKIRQAYLDLVVTDTNRYKVVDASGTIEEVLTSTMNIIKEKLNEIN